MNRPKIEDYERDVLCYTYNERVEDLERYIKDLNIYCDELEQQQKQTIQNQTTLKNFQVSLKDFYSLFTTNVIYTTILPIYVQLWNSGGHSSWCPIDQLSYDENCWNELIESIEVSNENGETRIEIITTKEEKENE